VNNAVSGGRENFFAPMRPFALPEPSGIRNIEALSRDHHIVSCARFESRFWKKWLLAEIRPECVFEFFNSISTFRTCPSACGMYYLL